jgi:predicted DNA-binding transcriptional regulator AlpA
MQRHVTLRNMPLAIAGIDYLTAAEVCRLVGISRQTLWRWRQDQRIPSGSRFRGKRLVFSAAEIEQIRTYASLLEPADRRPVVQLGLFAGESGSPR